MRKQFTVTKNKTVTKEYWNLEVNTRFDMTPFIKTLSQVAGLGDTAGLQYVSTPIYHFKFSPAKLFTATEVRKNMERALQECADQLELESKLVLHTNEQQQS